MNASLVYDGRKLNIPASMGQPCGDQLCGSPLENLGEIASRICYLGDTELLTPDGWVPIQNLPRGVPVATYNQLFEEMEFQTPTEYIANQFSGKMYYAENTKVSLAVTEDHELYVESPDGGIFVQAKNAAGTSYRVRRCAPFNPSIPSEPIVLPDRSSRSTCGSRVLTTKVDGKVIDSTKIYSFAALLGYYIAEGCINNGRTVVIYQKPGPVLDKIRSCVSILGFDSREYVDPRNGVVRIMIGSVVLADHLSECGQSSRTKNIPRYAFDWPMPVRAELLNALMDGDGHMTKNGAWVYNTNSRQLADDVQQLIIMSGRVGTISGPTACGMYRVRESLHGIHTVNKHQRQDRLELVENLSVYCVTVPNRVLFTRRHGKVVLCANCYDSLGYDEQGKRRGRSSEKLHEHIKEVRNHSVYEHCTYTVIFPRDSVLSPENHILACVNRKGVWVQRSKEDSETIEITANLRAVLEWDQKTTQINGPSATIVGWVLFCVGHQLAPRILKSTHTEIMPWGQHGPRLKTDNLTDDQANVSLWLYGSRGFTHEQVRHRFAMSQRSTRYVDEDGSPYIEHPLVTKFLNDGNVPHSVRQDCSSAIIDSTFEDRRTYRILVSNLETYLLGNGLDKQTARKQARGASRGYLGNALASEMIYTAPVSGWKWILSQRKNKLADAEIREVYSPGLDALKSSQYGDRFAEFVTVPSPDGLGTVLA